MASSKRSERASLCHSSRVNITPAQAGKSSVLLRCPNCGREIKAMTKRPRDDWPYAIIPEHLRVAPTKATKAKSAQKPSRRIVRLDVHLEDEPDAAELIQYAADGDAGSERALASLIGHEGAMVEIEDFDYTSADIRVVHDRPFYEVLLRVWYR